MKKKSKILALVDVYTNDLPEDSEWYQKRISACNSCEYNTKNLKEGEEKLYTHALKFVNGIVSGKQEDHCNICGCPISRKCAAATEECPLGEKGERPKWNRLLLDTGDTSNFDLVNLDPELYNVDIRQNGKEFVIDFGDIVPDEYSSSFELKVKGIYTFIDKISSSCGCTAVDTLMTGKDIATVNFTISTLGFPLDKFSKNIIVSYRDRGDKKVLVIKLTGYLHAKT